MEWGFFFVKRLVNPGECSPFLGDVQVSGEAPPMRAATLETSTGVCRAAGATKRPRRATRSQRHDRAVGRHDLEPRRT